MGQGWRAAAGMLAPQIEADPDDPLLELGLAGRELYSTLAGALRDSTGIDIGLWREGIAHVAATEAEATDLRARCAWQRQHGFLSDWLDAEEVKARQRPPGHRLRPRLLPGGARRRGHSGIHHGVRRIPPRDHIGGAGAHLWRGHGPVSLVELCQRAPDLGRTPAGDAGQPPDHRRG